MILTEELNRNLNLGKDQSNDKYPDYISDINFEFRPGIQAHLYEEGNNPPKDNWIFNLYFSDENKNHVLSICPFDARSVLEYRNIASTLLNYLSRVNDKDKGCEMGKMSCSMLEKANPEYQIYEDIYEFFNPKGHIILRGSKSDFVFLAECILKYMYVYPKGI